MTNRKTTLFAEKERRITGEILSRSASACLIGQDDEEERESKISAEALPYRSGCVTQLTNMRATAKQRGSDRRKRQISASLSF